MTSPVMNIDRWETRTAGGTKLPHYVARGELSHAGGVTNVNRWWDESSILISLNLKQEPVVGQVFPIEEPM